ncbi:HD-GYP domain-containing protein [Paenibacillus sp. IHBB 10380]|uniref:HD-GYP domain-containing protein n=1 Tax=Paenibacillus sp. IHBB 10380 TaxID=1566358 RepID=UPI0005CFEA8F|nr:HD-GYP domain-containing protein [Paenibacillus sp. IHBB 10380]AJS59617.1 HD family phosphohydrolase [Paenibacillus sp. IHBB 10380]
MRVHVTDLKPGDTLLSDTFNRVGLHVLSKGTVLKTEGISQLVKHNIEYVDVEPVTEDDILKESAALQDYLYKTKPQLSQVVKGFGNLFLEAANTGKVNDTVVDDIMEPLVDQLRDHTDVVSLLLALDQKDDYTYHHSMQVGMLSYYIASWLGYSQEDCYTVGKAGYLHDIGKCRIPLEILNKPGKLTPQEFDQIKLHTTYGYEIIRESSSDKDIALVALQHHERDDGSGYPLQRSEHEVHPFSQIVAVADVYSAMTTKRVYQSKQELLVVLREIHSLSFGKLAPKPTQAFIRHMLPNFIGKKVLLSSGQSGIIIMTNPIDYFRPLVQIDTLFIDLSVERSLYINEIYM